MLKLNLSKDKSRAIGSLSLAAVAGVVVAGFWLNEPVGTRDQRVYATPSANQICRFMDRGFYDAVSGGGDSERANGSAKLFSAQYDLSYEEIKTLYMKGFNFGKSAKHRRTIEPNHERMMNGCLAQADRIIADRFQS